MADNSQEQEQQEQEGALNPDWRTDTDSWLRVTGMYAAVCPRCGAFIYLRRLTAHGELCGTNTERLRKE